jgi:hypothetical protein
MRIGVTRPPEQSQVGDSASLACQRTIDSVRAKANRNESLARALSTAVVVASALIPLSLILAEQGMPNFWGKVLPGVLAVVSATAAGVQQFERPHERWKLYRGYQRLFEDELFRFGTKIGVYSVALDVDREAVLAERVAGLRTQMHLDWGGLLRSVESAADGSPRPTGSAA